MLDQSEYLEHVDTAIAKLKGTDNYGEGFTESPTVEHLALVESRPHVVCTTSLCYGPREVDSIIVIGLYIPHDGQCTTVINHVDGCMIADNADELFTPDDQAHHNH